MYKEMLKIAIMLFFYYYLKRKCKTYKTAVLVNREEGIHVRVRWTRERETDRKKDKFIANSYKKVSYFNKNKSLGEQKNLN